MASNTRWISYNDVNKHPEDSILLAYLRGQELEFRSSVILHIENENCSVCLQKLNELKQVSATLDILGEMRPYQYYPELSVAHTYAHMQNTVSRPTPANTAMKGAYYWQRPRKSAVRWMSVPVAFGLAILFTMAILVFANLSGRSMNPFSLAGGTGPGQYVLTVTIPPHPRSTQGVKVTATATDTTDAKEPHIKVCSMEANIAPLRLVICGYNFDSKHKATLVFYVPGKKPFSLRNVPVDKHGKFQVVWDIADCGNVPTYIYAVEGTSSKTIKAKLQIKSFGSCPAPATTSVAKPAGF